MSRWSADALTVAIMPGAIALMRRGAKEVVRGDQRDPARLLPAIEPLLAGAAWKARQVNVVFSNRLVRHVLTAPPGKALRQAEEITLARATLSEIYGEEASAWRVRVVSQPPQYGLLGVAVDEALCVGLETLAKRHAWHLAMRPLAGALAEPRGTARSEAWFVLEPGWATLFLGGSGCWRHVAALPMGGDWRERLPEWLARAAENHGIKARNANVLVQTVGLATAAPPMLEGWRWQMAQTAVGETDALALAMGCA